MTIRLRGYGHSFLPLLSMALLVVLAAGIAGAMWAWGGAGRTGFLSRDAANKIYAVVTVGASTEADLGRLGLDSAQGVRRLSALGVQEYFMPQTSRQFDRLSPAVRACFEDQDRCVALVVPVRAPDGGPFAAHAATPDRRMVFLLEDGTVAYKEMTGD